MSYIKYSTRGHIGVITVDRPEALNALTREMLSDLEGVVDAVDVDTIRCVIVTGAGERAFVAGADIGQQLPLTRAEAETWSINGNRVMRKIETLPVPTIAAVNGYALGGGSELALACDIRIAGENAVFGQPEVSLGILAGFGGTQRLPRLIGPGLAKELLFTTDRVRAGRALEIGLVNAVVPLAQLMDTAFAMAERIAANGPIGVRATKRAVHDGLQTDLDRAIKIEAEQFSVCFETEDQKNAMTAFLEKRKPDPFVNR